MNTDNKRKLVEKLVELTVRDPVSEVTGSASEIGLELREKLRERFKEQQVNIRLRHFSEDQLKALVGFYETDMGISILEAQNRISEELAAGIELISSGVFEELQQSIDQESNSRATSTRDQGSNNNT